MGQVGGGEVGDGDVMVKIVMVIGDDERPKCCRESGMLLSAACQFYRRPVIDDPDAAARGWASRHPFSTRRLPICIPFILAWPLPPSFR